MSPAATTAPPANRGGLIAQQGLRGPNLLRFSLGALLAFAALNAFGGGYYGLAGAKGIPRDWLRGSPFPDYILPSLILVVIVGGSFLLAAVAVFARWRHDRRLAVAAAVIVLAWLASEVAIIGYVSWMQPATAVAGALILALASRLPSPRPAAIPGLRTT
jgi:peptidoglycan/LPS O-acetylase OafA/YrhL